MKVAAMLPAASGDTGVSAGVLFARCVAQFQAAVILAERGLAGEFHVAEPSAD